MCSGEYPATPKFRISKLVDWPGEISIEAFLDERLERLVRFDPGTHRCRWPE